MKKYLIVLMALPFLLFSCESNIPEELEKEEVSLDYLSMIRTLGFDETGAVDMGEFFVVEEDIVLQKEELPKYQPVMTRQAYTDYFVSAKNVSNIRVKIDATLKNSSNWREAILSVLHDYNAVGSAVYMYEVSYDPDITISKSPINHELWALGEFPSADRKPGRTIRIQDNKSVDKLSLSEKKFLIAHELGHNIGFRHTDYLTAYYPRIAEGVSWEGANHISGTPIGTPTSQDPNSVFNSGFYYGGLIPWAGFSYYDKIAMKKLYPGFLFTSNVLVPDSQLGILEDVGAGYAFDVSARLYYDITTGAYGVGTIKANIKNEYAYSNCVVEGYSIQNASFNGNSLVYKIEVWYSASLFPLPSNPNLAPILRSCIATKTFTHQIPSFH